MTDSENPSDAADQQGKTRDGCGNPQRLHVRPLSRVKVKSALHGDMQKAAEMTASRKGLISYKAE